MKNLFPPRILKGYEQAILQDIFDENCQGRNANMKEVFSKHIKSLPSGYRPQDMDNQLIFVMVVPRVLLEGLIALHGEEKTLQICHQVIVAIREEVIADHTQTSIDLQPIADKIGLSLAEMSIYLEAIRPYGSLVMSFTTKPHTSEIVKLDLSYSDDIYYGYLGYTSMEDLITRHREKIAAETITDSTAFETDDLETQLERETQFEEICEKLDELTRQFKGSEEARQQLAQEVREIKDLYFKVNQKNFAQFVKAKIPDILLGKLFENDTLKLISHGVSMGFQLLQHHH